MSSRRRVGSPLGVALGFPNLEISECAGYYSLLFNLEDKHHDLERISFNTEEKSLLCPFPWKQNHKQQQQQTEASGKSLHKDLQLAMVVFKEEATESQLS